MFEFPIKEFETEISSLKYARIYTKILAHYKPFRLGNIVNRGHSVAVRGSKKSEKHM